MVSFYIAPTGPAKEDDANPKVPGSPPQGKGHVHGEPALQHGRVTPWTLPLQEDPVRHR